MSNQFFLVKGDSPLFACRVVTTNGTKSVVFMSIFIAIASTFFALGDYIISVLHRLVSIKIFSNITQNTIIMEKKKGCLGGSTLDARVQYPRCCSTYQGNLLRNLPRGE